MGGFGVIRHGGNDCVDHEDGHKRYAGFTNYFEVCSFNRPLWRDIRGPDTTTDIQDASGVYVNVTGRCYWPASYNLNYYESESRHELANSGASPYSLFDHVVSFDFTTERFDKLPFPATTLGEDATYTLVGYRGLLGALIYLKPELSSSSELSFQLHVWSLKKRSWKLLYVVSQLADVTRPILGLKDNRFLFLESKPSCGRSQLKVYDLYAKTEEKLDIYDRPGYMNGFSYAESTDPPLPDSRRKRSRKVKKRKSRNGKGRKQHSRKR